jgi:hypothetical protein
MNTIKEFDLSTEEQRECEGYSIHKKDHIGQNAILAGHYKITQRIQQSFKRSVLNKNGKQNLELLQKEMEKKTGEDRKKHQER